MANENLKTQKIYGKYIKDLPQVTEVNDTDDIIIEDSTPITSRAKLGVLFDSIKKRIASTWRFTELNNQTIVEYARESEKDHSLAYGTWYAANAVIPLSDSYLNYRDIIIRTGWNNQNGGIRDHRLSIQKNNTTLYGVVPIYHATKYIGTMVVEFNQSTPNQIKIVQSTGITSSNANDGIRAVMGRTKMS